MFRKKRSPGQNMSGAGVLHSIAARGDCQAFRTSMLRRKTALRQV
jgi:hypothetical protein